MMTKASVAVMFKLPIANCRLPICWAGRGSPRKIGNWQSAIGNDLIMLDDHALNNISHVLATIDRGFEFFVNLFPLQNSQSIWRIVK